MNYKLNMFNSYVTNYQREKHLAIKQNAALETQVRPPKRWNGGFEVGTPHWFRGDTGWKSSQDKQVQHLIDWESAAGD